MFSYLARDVEPGLTVFDTCLGLTVLDVVGPQHSRARRLVEDLFRRTMESLDGYAAREVLLHLLFAARKARTSPNKLTSIAKAILSLETHH
ncbi:hypothetical protein [Streptomyces sp. NPDC058579]|uniref:hypothetical protein n=1 Tax=Streptomyces sp. NPDC058579 TaxID=3346548 RepID=UPI00364CF1C7